MTEILIDALTLTGGASASSRIIVVKTGSSSALAEALITSKATRMSLASSGISSVATSVQISRRLRTVKGALRGNAHLSGLSDKSKTFTASIFATSSLNAYTYQRDVKSGIAEYLPSYYSDIEDVVRLSDVDATEVIRLNAYLDNVLDNFYVTSAEKLLDRWESEVNIDVIPQRSTDSRRHYINAKLRARGTTTKPQVKPIVDAFYYSEVTDKPRDQIGEIKLMGKRGIPKNLEDIDATVKDVLPAHLDTQYAFTYATWGELESAGLTWGETNDMTMKQLEETFYIASEYPHVD